jgi:hypothetical protein
MSFQRSLTGESSIYANVILNTNICANSVSTINLSATNASFTNITTNTWTAGNVSTPNVIATNGYFSNLNISTQSVSTLNVCTINSTNIYTSNASITNLSTSFINASTIRAYITNTSTQNVCLVATSTLYSSYNYLDNASITYLSASALTLNTLNSSNIYLENASITNLSAEDISVDGINCCFVETYSIRSQYAQIEQTLNVSNISYLKLINSANILRIQNNGGIIVKDRDTSDPALIQLNYASTPSIETYGLYLEANKSGTSGAYGRIGAGLNTSLQFYADTVIQAESTSTSGWNFYNNINSSYQTNLSNIDVSNLSATVFNTSNFQAFNVSGYYVSGQIGYMSVLYTSTVANYGFYINLSRDAFGDPYQTVTMKNNDINSSKPAFNIDGQNVSFLRFSFDDNTYEPMQINYSTVYVSNLSCVGNISTSQIYASQIYTSNTSFLNMSFGTGTGTTLSTSTLNASTINISTIKPTNISVTNLSVTTIASISSLAVSRINFCKGATNYGYIDAAANLLYDLNVTNATIASFAYGGNVKFAYNTNSVSMYTSLFGTRAYFSNLSVSNLSVSTLTTTTFNPTTINTTTVNVSNLNNSTANISNASLFNIIGNTITVSTSVLNSNGTFNISVLNYSSLSLPANVNFSTINTCSANICNISITSASIDDLTVEYGLLEYCFVNSECTILDALTFSSGPFSTVGTMYRDTSTSYIALQINNASAYNGYAFQNSNGDNLATMNINTSRFTVENASFSNVSISSLTVSTLTTSTFNPTTINTTTVNVSNLNNSTANISNASLFNIIGNTITVSTSVLNSNGTFNISVLNCSSSNISLPANVNFSTINACSANISNASLFNIIGNTITVSTSVLNSNGTFNISVLNCSSSNISALLPANVNFSTINACSANICNISITSASIDDLTVGYGFTVDNIFVNTECSILDALTLRSGTGSGTTWGTIYKDTSTSYLALQTNTTTKYFGYAFQDVIGTNIATINTNTSRLTVSNISTTNISSTNVTISSGLTVDGNIRSNWNTSDLIKNSTQIGSFYDTTTAMTVTKTDTGQTFVFGPQNSNTSLSTLPVGLYLVSGSFRLKTNAAYRASITTANCGICWGSTYNFGSGNTSREAYQTLGAINTSGTTNETWTMSLTGVVNMSLTNRYIGVYVAATANQAAAVGSITIAIDNVTVVKIA